MGALNGAIDDHKTGDYVVTRKTQPALVKGKPTGAVVTTTFVATASVQPFEGDLKDLAEGQSVENAKTIYAYSDQGFFAREHGYQPDVITLPDGDYTIQKALRWDHWGEVHYVITAYKINPV